MNLPGERGVIRDFVSVCWKLQLWLNASDSLTESRETKGVAALLILSEETGWVCCYSWVLKFCCEELIIGDGSNQSYTKSHQKAKPMREKLVTKTKKNTSQEFWSAWREFNVFVFR